MDKFIYLGILFVPSGVFTPTQSRQAQRASSALYMIKKGLLKNRDFSIKPKTALKLFDAYVKPILLYNCEVWAPAGWRNSSAPDPHDLNLINLDNTESIHTNFCKYILGLSETCSNIAARLELGRSTMEIDIKLHIIKYWQRISTLSNENILKRAYIENIQLSESGKNRVWSTCVRTTLESNGWGSAWHTNPYLLDIEHFKLGLTDQLKQRIHSTLFDDNVKMGSANKLRTYRLHKHKYMSMENYLQDVSNFKHRKALSKLRTSDHKLNIEAGRRTKIPINERICKFCNTDIEDEKHLLLQCSLYDNLRNKLFDDITMTLPYFKQMNTVTQLRVMLQPCGRVAVHVARFVEDAFILRKSRF